MLVCAARAAGAEAHLGIRIADCHRDCENEHWAITVSGTGAPAVLAPWIIDATGRASWFARRQGVERHSLDRLVAMVRFGSLDSTDDRTFIEAHPEGWWYAAGLPGNRVAVAFFTDADLMPSGHTSHWDGLLKDTELVSSIMASACDLSAVHVAAASSAYLSQFTGSGWVAIGDAAQSHDPCSGQGITKALESGLAAAEAIMVYRSGDCRAMDRFPHLPRASSRNSWTGVKLIIVMRHGGPATRFGNGDADCLDRAREVTTR